MSTDNVDIKKELDEHEIEMDHNTNLKTPNSSDTEMSINIFPEYNDTKEEIQQNSGPTLSTENKISFKNEIDIEEHELLFPKAEPTDMECNILFIKSEHASEKNLVSSVRDMATVILLDNVHIKQESKQNMDDEGLDEGNIHEIKSDRDNEEHDLFLSKTESADMENNIFPIKSEHELYLDVDIPAEVDPLGPCDDVEGCPQFIDSTKQINSEDQPVGKQNCIPNTLLQTRSPVLAKTKSHQCTTCNKKFPYLSHLLRHLPIHTGVKSYECTMCEKKFTQLSTLITHRRIHTGEKSYECTACAKKFLQLSTYTKHLLIHDEKTSYKCTLCNAKFSKSSILKSHLRFHTGDKRYECTVCNEKFVVSSHLVEHSRVHTGEKSYECTICHKQFSRSSHLVDHTRIHTGEKPYECTVCNKKFSVASNLAKHVRTHTGEKPYECNVCHRKFSQSSTLVSHLRTHTRQKL